MAKLYSADKLKLIIKALTDKGLYDNDPDFPNDEMERWYWTPVGKEVVRSTCCLCLSQFLFLSWWPHAPCLDFTLARFLGGGVWKVSQAVVCSPGI